MSQFVNAFRCVSLYLMRQCYSVLVPSIYAGVVEFGEGEKKNDYPEDNR